MRVIPDYKVVTCSNASTIRLPLGFKTTILDRRASLAPSSARHDNSFQMTPAAKPLSSDSCVKSGFHVRRLALRRLLECTTVQVMTQQRPAALQSSTEWESIFHSYRPLRICYAPREMICQAGSYVAGIHLVVQGVVSDMMLSMGGARRNSDILGSGDLIGLEILQKSSDGLSISLCRALTPVELLFIERGQVESALDDDPALQRAFLQYAASRYVSTRRDPRQQESAEAQLCRLLLRLGEACELAVGDGRITLPEEITLRTLGELLCISTRQLRHARQAIQSLEIGDSGIEFDLDEVHRMIDSGCLSTT